MRLTILGCGTSTGVPFIHCKCRICKSKNPKNKRLRASAWVQINGKSFLIDTGPDLRQQALREEISQIDAVLYTHPHADHTHGIDELRSFNFIQKTSIPVFGNSWTCNELKAKFRYIFEPGRLQGGGIPQLTLNLFDPQVDELNVLGQKIIPIPLQHGTHECVGYRFDSVAYVTDCSYIPPVAMQRMQALSVLVLDCLRHEPHETHFTLSQALETIAKLKPKKAYLTHLGHEFDYARGAKDLPKGVAFAFDGLTINV